MIDISRYIREMTARFDARTAAQLNPLVLASVGDAAYSLYMRKHFVANHDFGAHALHENVAKYVKASAQADAFFRIEPMLTEEEQYIAKRGRNSHPGTVPKNADIMDYRTATALEAVFGYLFLTGQEDRLDSLIKKILEKENGIQQ